EQRRQRPDDPVALVEPPGFTNHAKPYERKHTLTTATLFDIRNPVPIHHGRTGRALREDAATRTSLCDPLRDPSRIIAPRRGECTAPRARRARGGDGHGAVNGPCGTAKAIHFTGLVSAFLAAAGAAVASLGSTTL